MIMKWKYETDLLNGIFYKHFYGSITIDDILQSWMQAIASDLIPKNNKRFIIDLQNGNAPRNVSDREIIDNYYLDHSEIFEGARIAMVTTKPKDFVAPMLMKCEDGIYCSAPFTSMDAAVDWVLDKGKQ